MTNNIFELISQFNQFQNMIKRCGQDPEKMLEEEMKKRNMTPAQINELLQQAQGLKQILGVK